MGVSMKENSWEYNYPIIFALKVLQFSELIILHFFLEDQGSHGYQFQSSVA